MKNIKALLVLTIIISLSHTIMIFYSLVEYEIINLFRYNTIDSTPLIIPLLMVLSFLSLLSTYLLIIHGLWQILKEGYFNLKSPRSFKIAGILIISMALLSLSSILKFTSSFPYSSFFDSGITFNIIKEGYLTIMGYGLIIIAGILKKGTALQEENKLTI